MQSLPAKLGKLTSQRSQRVVELLNLWVAALPEPKRFGIPTISNWQKTWTVDSQFESLKRRLWKIHTIKTWAAGAVVFGGFCMDQFHPVSIAAFRRKGQDRNFKFPFDPQAAQEAWGMSSGWMSDPEVFQLQVRLQAAAELLESWPMAGEIGEML